MSNFIIDTVTKLKEKLEMVESLSEIEIATKLIEKTKCSKENNILNDHYTSLNCNIKGIDKNVNIFYF